MQGVTGTGGLQHPVAQAKAPMAPPEHAAAPRGKDGYRVPASTAGRQKSVLAHGCHCQTQPCVDVSTCTKHLDCSEDAVRYLRV